MVARSRARSAVATKRPATRNNSSSGAAVNSPKPPRPIRRRGGGEAALCRHVNEKAEKEPAAMRDFSPASVGFGSIASLAIGANRLSISAMPRNRTCAPILRLTPYRAQGDLCHGPVVWCDDVHRRRPGVRPDADGIGGVSLREMGPIFGGRGGSPPLEIFFGQARSNWRYPLRSQPTPLLKSSTCSQVALPGAGIQV